MPRLCSILFLTLILAAPAFSGQKEHVNNLRTIQRRVYAFTSEQSALRHGIEVLQSLDFSLEQVFPLENAARLLRDNGQESEILCGLKVRPLPDHPGKVEVWLNLKNDPLDYRREQEEREIAVISAASPYQTFFQTFERTAGNALKGDPR